MAEERVVSYYPIFRSAGKDTKYSNAAWAVIAFVVASAVFFIFRDLDNDRTVAFHAPPGTRVRVDGQDVQPPYLLQLEVGPHELEIEAPGKGRRGGGQTFRIEVTDESRAQVFVIEDGEIRRL